MLTQFLNHPLRLGEVKEIIFPDDPKSQSQKFIEYRVRVYHRDGRGATSSTDYRNCFVGSLFGSLGDKFRYTLRASSLENPNSSDIRDGSKVLLLCINGETNNAIIIGAIPDDRQDNDLESDGHNLEFEFNGLNTKINNDGELLITFKGATNSDGTIKNSDTSVSGSYFQFDKNGNLNLVSKKDFNLNSGGNINLNSDGVLIGAATDSFLLGSTYRAAQAQLNNELIIQFTKLFSFYELAQATAASVPNGAGLAGAFGSIQITTARILAAFKQFESLSSTFLSSKNKSD